MKVVHSLSKTVSNPSEFQKELFDMVRKQKKEICTSHLMMLRSELQIQYAGL